MVVLQYMKDVRIHFDKYNLFEVALVAALIYALWTIGNFLLVLGVGLIVSTFIEDFVGIGKRYHIPRVASVIIFYILSIIVFAAVIIFVVPSLAREILDLARVYPEVQTFLSSNSFLNQASQDISLTNIVEQFQNEELRNRIFSGALGFFGGIINLLVIFVVSFYLSINKNGIDYVLRIATPMKYEEMVVSIWHRVQRKIGSWFRGQLIIAVILMILTYAGLALAGIPYAFLLAILAGVFGLVPYGIFLAVIPAIIIALGSGGIWMGVGVALYYFILQQILDLGLQPLIVNKLTGVPSLVVILSVIVGAKLFGIYGLLLAMPLALFIMELIAESEKQKSSRRDPLISPDEEITVIIDTKK